MTVESNQDQTSEKKKTDGKMFEDITRLDRVDDLIKRLEGDDTKELIKERMTQEKQATYDAFEEKIASETGMIELHLDLKFSMKPWKKALVFSFLFYLIVLFVFIVLITFIKKDFDFKLVSMISAAYVTVLVLSFRFMYNIFKEKFASIT